MRCNAVRRALSEELDGVALSNRATKHLETCPSCPVYRDRLQTLRSSLDAMSTDAAPDVVDRVMTALPRQVPVRPLRWLSPALGVATGVVIGVVLAGGLSGPGVSVAGRLPDEVIARQALLKQMSATFTITERIKPGSERTYNGAVHFESPEYLALRVDQIDGPGGWSENDWTLLVDNTTSLVTEPFPCPELGGCVESPPRSVRVVGRDPFSATVVAPLDVVIPAAVLKGAEEPPALPERTVAGRVAVGFEVTAAQARPLLDAYVRTGNWREVHDTDPVSIWLDSEYLTPLLVEVTAAQTPDRTLWAARRGYEDGREPFLTIEYQSLTFVEEERPSLDNTTDVSSRDSGFRPTALPTLIEPGMPLVSSGHIDGFVETEVWAWSDGRAWIRLDRTVNWAGTGLFGNSGLSVEGVATEQGVVYQAGDGSRVFVHGDGYDAVVAGSVATEELVAIAGMLPGPQRAVPASWPEAPIAEEAAERAYMPLGVPDFGEPILHSSNDALVIDLFGGGERAVRITQRAGDRISPPLDPDARAVRLRGVIARYSPTFGILEWVEDELLFTLEAPGLALTDAIEIAEALTLQSGP